MLSPEEIAVLEFERAWWAQPGPKDQAIEHALGLTASDYYDRLRTLASRSEAVRHDPLTVKRVIRLIEPP